MFSRWIKIFLWILVIGLLLKMWFGNEVEEDPVLDIDFDKVVNYNVIAGEEEELERGGKILHYSLVIEEKAEKEEIKETVKVLVNTAQEDKSFNALTVDLFDRKEFVGRTGATLGTVVYAPEGKIDLADTVSAGAYHEMEFSYDILNKKWERQPAQEEVKVWAEWQDIYEQMNEHINAGVISTESSRRERGRIPALHAREEISHYSLDFIIARRFDLSVNEVADIRDKQLRWELLDVQR